MADATCTITGTVGQEPELRFTGGGKALVDFSVAVRRSWKVNNEWQESTTWWKVVVWDQYAENVASSIHKGTRVTCTGFPELRTYDKKDGGTGFSLELRCDEIAINLRWARAEVEKLEREKSSSKSSERKPIYDPEEPF